MKASPDQAERLHRFAHDLRNRLVGLQQVLEQLKDAPPEADRAELTVFGEQQFFKALREVEGLLDDLGVERGTMVPQAAPLRVADLVRTHIDLMQHRFQRKHQFLELDLDEALMAKADARMLGNVLDALLSNASKFSATEGTITIQAHGEGDHAMIVVKDHGTGLSPEDLSQVFVRFAWLSNRPTGGESQGRGTLGRAREWMVAQGGDLVAESAGAGRGCRFTMRIPKG